MKIVKSKQSKQINQKSQQYICDAQLCWKNNENFQQREKIYALNLLMKAYLTAQANLCKNQLKKQRLQSVTRERAPQKILPRNCSCFTQTLSNHLTDKQAYQQQKVKIHEKPWDIT